MRLLLIILLLSFPQWLMAECLKEVFNRYCLGGDIAQLVEQLQPKTEKKTKDTSIYEFSELGLGVSLEVKNGIIISVSRNEAPGDWINFQKCKHDIGAVYGRGEDFSQFPPSASSRSARLNAVATGKGQGKIRWQQTGWQIELLWNNTQHVRLKYQITPKTSGLQREQGL